MKAYSYLRFSTPEQRHGDSIRRQTVEAQRFARRHGLELDAQLTFEDAGVSGFRGANAARGALRAFLRLIEDGVIETGSVLILENLDRMSRQAPWEALPTLQEIINGGVALGIPSKDRIIDREQLAGSSGVFLLMEVLIDLQRAHEESATKSRRLRAAWEGKRDKADSTLLTRITPGWIEVTDDGEPVLIEERAEVVRRIFAEYVAGSGKAAIAAGLNREGVPPFGRAAHWHRSYVLKILNSPACVGTYVPHTLEYVDGRKVRKPQEPVTGYYPSVIDEDTYQLAAEMMAAKGKQRGRHAGKPVQSLLAGLAACPQCGSTMTRVNKGSRSVPYLVCVSAKNGAGCEYRSVRLADVEGALIARRGQLVGEMPHSDAQLGDDIENHEAQLGVLEDELERLLDVLQQGGHSDAVTRRLRALEDQRDALKAELSALLERASQEESKLVNLKASRLAEALEAEPVDRQTANAALRQCLERVVVDYRSGFLELHWNHGGVSSLFYTMPR